MRFLFVTGGSPATVFALVPLATAARDAGHQVFMAGNEDLMPAITNCGIPAVSITPAPLHHYMFTESDGSPARMPEGPRETMLFAGRAFARMADASFDALLGLAVDWRPDIVIGGGAIYAAGLVANQVEVPYARHTWDLAPTTELDEAANEVLAPRLRKLALEQLPPPRPLIEICPPALRSPEQAADVQPMRFVAANSQRRLEPWMYTRTERKHRILITAGTRGGQSREHNTELLRRLGGTLSKLDIEMLVAGPDDMVEDLRAVLGEARVGWFPMDVVAHTCDLIVHHGGGTTAMAAMAAGTPQLVIPQEDYQVACCRPITEFGAGLLLEPGQDTADNIAQACQTILADATYRQRTQILAEEVAAQPSPAAVVQALAQRAGR
jgi:UDP:flavonoid glycosyltransferase YjiC (YdhE family)